MTEGYRQRFLEWLRRTPNGATREDISRQYPRALASLTRLREDQLIFHFDGRWHWAARKEPLVVNGYAISNRGYPVAGGVVCKCHEDFCPAHGRLNRSELAKGRKVRG